MAFKLLARTRENTDTVGTGAINLTGATAPNNRTFGSQMTEGDTTFACALSSDGLAWEEGLYTLTSGDLVRTGARLDNHLGTTAHVSLTGGRIFAIIPRDLLRVLSLALGAGGDTDGYVVAWNDTAGTFELSEQTGGGGGGSVAWHPPCELATTGTLPANTYNNGTAGVGATLTGNSNGALATIDGIATEVGYRVLVPHEATPSHNGVYAITQIGDGSSPYILTRATDFNTDANIGQGHVISIGAAGVANGRTLWTTYTSDEAITVGTTDIEFSVIGIRNSEGLDLVAGATPGTLLIRGDDGWIGLPPGTDGQVLAMTATEDGAEWVDPASGGASALDDLSDVVITSPASGQVIRHNGTTWVNGTVSSAGGLFSPSLSAVPTIASTGLTTWVNQSPATVADSAAGVVLTCGFSFTSAFHFIKKASPTPPYRIKALIGLHSPSPNQYQGFGFGWYDGTNKLQLAKLQYENTYPSPHLIVVRQSNPTTYVSSDFTGPSVFPNPIWIMLRDDGTNVWFFWSADGVNYLTHSYMIAKASGYLGSSGYAHIAFGVDPNNQNTTATLMSYEETA